EDLRGCNAFGGVAQPGAAAGATRGSRNEVKCPAMDEIERRMEGNLLYELIRKGEGYEVRADGRKLFTTDARGEAGLADLAIAPWEGRDDVTVLLAGLGAGRTLRALLDRPGVLKIDVVEYSQTVVDWHNKYFADLAGRPTEDARVAIHVAELGAF